MKKLSAAGPWIWTLVFIHLFGTRTAGQAVDRIDWKYDIDLMGKELVKKHADLFFKYDSTSFFHGLDRVASQADQQTPFGNSVKLQQQLARLGDENTRVNYHYQVDPGQIIPLQLYWFEEGVYAIGTLERHRAILGKKITAINQVPIQVIADSMATMIPADQTALLRDGFPGMVTWMQLLNHFGFATADQCTLEFEEEDGKYGALNLSLPEEDDRIVEVEPITTPVAWKDRKSYFRDQYLPQERLYYIQYNKCWSREVEEIHGSGASALFMPSFKEFEKRVIQTIRKNPVDKLVFDLRFNDGGEPGQGSQFIQKLSRMKLKGAGRYYLIIGRATRGAALENAVEFMTASGALVVGEPSGGRPNHFGGIGRFVLPETNLIVNYSTCFISMVEGDPPSLLPDLSTPLTFRDYAAGTDPALDAIIREKLQ